MTPRRFFDPTTPARVRLGALLAALVVAAAGCSSGDDGAKRAGPRVQPPPGKPLSTLGPPEDRLDLVAPAGYAEDGRRDPSADWVSAFEARTGCQVAVRAADGGDELADLLATGRYDGAAVPSAAMLRLIADGHAAPVNPDLVRNYDDLAEDLREQPFATAGGRVYAVPHSRSAALLVWRRDRVPGTLSRSDALFEPPQLLPHRGNVAVQGGPMAIADAAVWLQANRPELGIADPFELGDAQFQAAVALLEAQKPFVGTYWSTDDEAWRAFAEDEAVVGFAPQGVALRLQDEHPELTLEARLPREGSTGEAVSWVVARGARHPGCMYRWIGHALSPAVQAEASEHTGDAPANLRACDFTRDREHCARVHADDASYWESVALRTTPVRECGDERGRACKGYEDWVAGWAEVAAAPG